MRLPDPASRDDELFTPQAMPSLQRSGEACVDVSAAQQILLAADACKAGTRVVKRTYPGLNHGETVNASLKDSLPFVGDVMAGKPVGSTCEP